MTGVFDFVNEINFGKNDIMTDKESEKQYIPYIVNNSLSYFPDTLYYANIMNMSGGLSKRMQYDYHLASIRPRKRFSKWTKREVDDRVEIVAKHYKVNSKIAEYYLTLLSEEQFNKIKEMYKELC